MKFGLKELQQLWNIVSEIAGENNIPYNKAVSKFLKDVEVQYDNKLGFESKVTEKKNELALLNNQINNNRIILQISPFIGPTLFSLFQKGIGEQDIMDINQLVEVCSNDATVTNNYNTNIENIKNNDKEEKISNRSEYWRSLTDELKKYRDIKSAIKDQLEKRDKIQKEVNDLNNQKQEILNYCQIAISLINTINNKISYFKGFMDYFNKDWNNKINAYSRSFLPSFTFLIYINCNKKSDNAGKK